jgi:hypothetical protein
MSEDLSFAELMNRFRRGDEKATALIFDRIVRSLI